MFINNSEYQKLPYNELFVEEETFYLKCYKNLKANPNNKDYLKTDETIKKFVMPYLKLITTPKVLIGDPSPNTPEKLYEKVIDLYTHFSFYKNGINPYHNVCHGFMTMIISGKLFLDYAGYADKDAEPDLNDLRIVLFAGLMHDAAHPGVGNGLINIDSIKKMYLKNFETFDETYGEHLCDLFDGFADRDFTLEEVHNTLAIYYSFLYMRDLNGEMDQFLSDSIMKTDMNHHFGFKADDDVSNINLIVHFADIAAYASNNQELTQHLAISCIEEFFYESYFAKNSGLCNDPLKSTNVLTDDEIIVNIIAKQAFFLNEVLIGKSGIFPKISTLDFLPIVIDEIKADQDNTKSFIKNKMYEAMDNNGGFKEQKVFIQEYFIYNMYKNSIKLTNAGINFTRLDFAITETKNTFKNIHTVCSIDDLTGNVEFTKLVNDNTSLIEVVELII